MAVTIQDDMLEAAALLPDDLGDLYLLAVTRYAKDGTVPGEGADPVVRAMFTVTKTRIDMSVKAYESGKRGAERRWSEARSGDVKGGTDGGLNGTPSKAPTWDPTHAKNKSKSKKESKKEMERESGFKPPTPEEVREYAREKGITLDAEDFCDYYGAQGWRLSNGNRMRDWRLAANRWARRRSGKADAHQEALDRYSGYVMRQDEEVG